MSHTGMNKIYENEYIAILVDDYEKLLVYTITGYPKFSEVIRRGHDKIYDIVLQKRKESPVLKVIADLRLAKILLNPDIQFIAKVSYPRLAQAGVRDLVILHSGDIHVKINVDKTIDALGKDIFHHVNVLSSVEEALDWFNAVSPLK